MARTDNPIASWCDKLSSTPGVGVFLTPYFTPSSEIVDALSPIINRFIDKGQPTFSVEKQDTFSFSFSTNDGFQYSVEPEKTSLVFTHKLRGRAVSGGLPVMEMISVPRPYTELLKDMVERTVDVTARLPGRSRVVRRVGIVSTTFVDEDAAPPGIQSFLEYMGRPWRGFVEAHSMQIAAQIDDRPDWTDRAIHTLARSDGDEPLLTIMLDFQRAYKREKVATREHLGVVLPEVERAALEYFEDLAVGGRFIEQDCTGDPA